MSCHVAIIVSILKNHYQKLFHFTKLFINILQASLLVLIKIKSFAEGVQKERGLEKVRSNPQKRGFINFGLLRFARNDRYKKQNRTRCAPHGVDECNDGNNTCHYEGEARSNLFKSGLLRLRSQ